MKPILLLWLLVTPMLNAQDPIGLPPGSDPQPLIPETTPIQTGLSSRIANYQIDVRLDPVTAELTGSQMLLWHNRAQDPVFDLHFHLYLNGFRNNRSSFMRAGKTVEDDPWGYMEIQSIRVKNGSPHESFDREEDFPAMEDMDDKTVTIQFLQPDDSNEDDKTYLMIPLDEPIPPEASVWVHIDFRARLPRPPIAAGTVADEEFFFVGQWFPKIAVFEDGAWAGHQYHRGLNFYADFGVYHVAMTVPTGNLLGATGVLQEAVINPDGTTTHHYSAEDVVDFAWSTSPRFLENRRRVQDVDVRLLLQPEHVASQQRYLDAAEVAIRYYQDHYGDYPFPNLTIVDSKVGTLSPGGIAYPTLFTVETFAYEPEGSRFLEMVIAHEFGNNYFQHMLASNAFKESWLDEGIASYIDAVLMEEAYGGLIFDNLGMGLDLVQLNRLVYRNGPSLDETVRDGWSYDSTNSYQINSYNKPALILLTLRNYLGPAVMRMVMRTYVSRFSFKHPRTADFVGVASEVSGQDLSWFFDAALNTRAILDYGVAEAKSTPVRTARGFDFTADAGGGTQSQAEAGGFSNQVKLRRFGDFRFPVEIELRFADGSKRRENWDGQSGWKTLRVHSKSALVSARVDPEYNIPLDHNFSNNSYAVDRQTMPATKASLGWLIRLQFLLDLFSL